MSIDVRKLESVEVDGINSRDYPDFCDAYIDYAEIDGRPLTDKELDEVNDDGDFVYEKVLENIY